MSSASVSGVEPTRLQKAVEAIAITPAAAAELVDGYRRSFEARHERPPVSMDDKRRIASMIIGRYSKLAAASGALTAVPSVVPGIGTAVAVVGGGLADIAVALKLQIDMCTCLVEVFETGMSVEDKKHLAFVLALAGSAEQLITKGGKKAVEKIAQKLVIQYFRGPLLVTVKELFKKVSITVTQKAAAKVVPFGVGVALSGTANYVLTTVVGRVAIAVLAKDVK